MKYDLDLEGFIPFEFLENNIIVSKIVTIKKLDKNEIKSDIDDLKEHFRYRRHIKINSKNIDKIVFVLKRKQEKLCVGFRNNEIQIGFNYREYTNKDLELDNLLADIKKKQSKINKEIAKEAKQ